MQIDKNSKAYKYVQAAKDREARMKRNQRNNWLSNNWIALSSLLVSIIALVIALLK